MEKNLNSNLTKNIKFQSGKNKGFLKNPYFFHLIQNPNNYIKLFLN